jgi:hypothetical protein
VTLPSSRRSKDAPNSQWLEPAVRALASGIFEGEGWVTLAPRRRADGSNAYTLLAGANNTSVETLSFFAERWGGSSGCYERPGHRPLHTWRLCGRGAAEFLRDIEPFLISKRLRAKVDVALWFYFLQDTRSADDDLRRKEEACAFAMRALNRRGASSLPGDACRELVTDLHDRVLEHTRQPNGHEQPYGETSRRPG